MAAHLRISIPNDVAEELVSEGFAVHPLGTRGAGLPESVSIAVDAINTGSALVSIAAATVACKRLAELILLRRRATDPDELTINISVGGELKSLSLDRTAPGAVDEAFDFFVDSLDVE